MDTKVYIIVATIYNDGWQTDFDSIGVATTPDAKYADVEVCGTYNRVNLHVARKVRQLKEKNPNSEVVNR